LVVWAVGKPKEHDVDRVALLAGEGVEGGELTECATGVPADAGGEEHQSRFRRVSPQYLEETRPVAS
jgi:hypothetical protein